MKLLIVFIVVLFGSVALGDVSMLSPVESGDSVIDVGSVESGQVFELVFSDNSGSEEEWSSLDIDESTFPEGWFFESDSTESSLVALVGVPANAKPNFYFIDLVFSNGYGSEVKGVKVAVKEDLARVSFLKRPRGFSVVGDDVVFSAVVSNDSIAPFPVTFSSSLPQNWFSEKSIVVPPKGVVAVDLNVTPLFYGKRLFTFKAVDGKGLVESSFPAELNVRTTLRGKLSVPNSGFSFFSFSLMPFHIFNSFFSLLLP